MRSERRVLLILVTVVVAVVVALNAGFLQHWFAIHLGFVNAGPDHFYNFWSGFGSDLGEVTLLVGVVAAYRHHNCHVARCPRLGKPVAGTPYVACPRHHPAHKGTKRGVTLATIESAHENRRR